MRDDARGPHMQVGRGDMCRVELVVAARPCQRAADGLDARLFFSLDADVVPIGDAARLAPTLPFPCGSIPPPAPPRTVRSRRVRLGQRPRLIPPQPMPAHSP